MAVLLCNFVDSKSDDGVLQLLLSGFLALQYLWVLIRHKFCVFGDEFYLVYSILGYLISITMATLLCQTEMKVLLSTC